MFLLRRRRLFLCIGAPAILIGCTAQTHKAETTDPADSRSATARPAAKRVPTIQSHVDRRTGKVVAANPAGRMDKGKSKNRSTRASASHQAKAKSRTAIAWAKDWTSAKKQASASGKLIMVDFYTDWCGWCKRLDRDTYSDNKVIKLSEQFVSLKLNAERSGRTLARQHRVRGFPTILFFDAKGKEVGRIYGYLPPIRFAKKMKEIKASYHKT